MVQGIINLGEKEDRILNIVKAKYGLKNRNQAILFVLNAYSESFLEPVLRPDFLGKLERIKKEKGEVFSDIEELKRKIEA